MRPSPRLLVPALLLAACGDASPVLDAAGAGGDGGRGDAAPGSTDGGGAGPDAAVDAAPGVGEPAGLVGITLYHNQIRQQVQTATPLPALVWSDALAATAAAWAARCVDTAPPAGLIDHNPGRSMGHPYYVGENIYASSGTASAMGAVQSWASEKAKYDYASNTCSGVCGHYTQLVWRDTLEVGCALATCPGLTYSSVIVCDYGPGGNISGQRPY